MFIVYCLLSFSLTFVNSFVKLSTVWFTSCDISPQFLLSSLLYPLNKFFFVSNIVFSNSSVVAFSANLGIYSYIVANLFKHSSFLSCSTNKVNESNSLLKFNISSWFTCIWYKSNVIVGIDKYNVSILVFIFLTIHLLIAIEILHF